MKIRLVIVVTVLLSMCWMEGTSQNSSESITTALVYKIANYIKWPADTCAFFNISIISNNDFLIEKFRDLSELTKIGEFPIKITVVKDINNIEQTHLLYVSTEYNIQLKAINEKINSKNTLLVTEEHDQPGEIMVNIKLNSKTQTMTFEYNRANILFQGLEISDKIVLLKGTEIEIRELYLHAKKLWDEQRAHVEILKRQTETQKINLQAQKDSIFLMKSEIIRNQSQIENQNKIIRQKDSISNFLNTKIKQQQNELTESKNQIKNYASEKIFYERAVARFRLNIEKQKRISDSLSLDINQKTNELIVRQRVLGDKEDLIKRQYYFLIAAMIVIFVVTVLIILIFRAYRINNRAKIKIAEQKQKIEQTLQKLQETQNQLITSEKMASLGVLVAGIAHEINNPVNFISSGIEGIEKVIDKIVKLLTEFDKLKSTSTSVEIADFWELKSKLKIQNSLSLLPEVVENIKIGIKRTIDIINGLRLYTHIDKEEKVRYDINRIIDTSLLLLKNKIEKNIIIIKNYSTLPLVYVYPGKMSQVFMNLITNAIDAIEYNKGTAIEKKIQIKTESTPEKVSIEILDTGIGIPPKIMDKLFDPFFTTKKVGNGTGLGLSITLGIINEHNGTIFVKNNEPCGAVFTIELPVN